MKLNLPILDNIKDCKHILIAGMGGGYDVFSGLPIYFELEAQGYDVHLANFSFSDISGLYEGEQLTDTLVGVNTDIEGIFYYFPEYYLAQWFFAERNEDIEIWCFERTSVQEYIKNYKTLVQHLEIDCIILVDGGVDSLMRGNEPEAGTLFEDILSLLAVNELISVPKRLVACIGLGVEYEIGYAHLFENIAHLTKIGAFQGSCTLTKAMDSYQKYKDAVMYIFDQQPEYPSVICSSVISAIEGHYGDYHLIKRTEGSRLHISPLIPIYWFFDAPTVARENLLISALKESYSFDDAWSKMQARMKNLPERQTPVYPLR